MIVSIIVAMDEKQGIGFQNRLPWKLSADLKRFKSLTMHHHVIMGRKTFESIGRLLPGRKMIVISRNPNYQTAGCLVFHSLDEAIDFAKNEGEEEAFIIGGESVYKAALPLADRIYLTRVQAVTQADAYFPKIDENEWREVYRTSHPADQKNEYPTTFSILQHIERN